VHQFGGSSYECCDDSELKSSSGMPIQSSTDCGSETTDLYGFANALRYVQHVDALTYIIHLIRKLERHLPCILILMSSPHIAFSGAYTTSPLNEDGFDYVFNGEIMSKYSGKRALAYIIHQIRINSMLFELLILP